MANYSSTNYLYDGPVESPDQPQDWADRHVERWRDHWVDVTFDDDVEAIVVRMGRLVRHFRMSSTRPSTCC